MGLTLINHLLIFPRLEAKLSNEPMYVLCAIQLNQLKHEKIKPLSESLLAGKPKKGLKKIKREIALVVTLLVFLF